MASVNRSLGHSSGVKVTCYTFLTVDTICVMLAVHTHTTPLIVSIYIQTSFFLSNSFIIVAFTCMVVTIASWKNTHNKVNNARVIIPKKTQTNEMHITNFSCAVNDKYDILHKLMWAYLRSHSLLLSGVAGFHGFCTNPGQHRSHFVPQVICLHSHTNWEFPCCEDWTQASAWPLHMQIPPTEMSLME